VFDNHEEVDAYPIYRDPIHDFGFLKFDPRAVKHMTINSLDLRPDLAKIGLEIRVVGNDAGEKLSILAGFISRIDRNAPEYSGGYIDFNTCYYQASAGASGGSSGSPVVDINGYVIAINAGAKRTAATGYFLPVHGPLRALKCLQNEEHISRGDIQCQFSLKPFDECKRLGLGFDRESEIRHAFPKETNMLVATRVLPEGPAHDKIEEGDILISVNGEMLTVFHRLDDILDSNVDNLVEFLLCRGGKDIKVEISIGNLHNITPHRALNLAGALFQEVSYQQARRYGVACKGVCIGDASGSFNSITGKEPVLETIDDQKIPDLDTFIEIMKRTPDKARIVVTYKNLSEIHTLKTKIVYVDRHWWKEMTLAVRNDETGLWDVTKLGDALPPVPPSPQAGSFVQLQHVAHPGVEKLVQSFVGIDCACKTPPMPGSTAQISTHGMGLVIDADKGLVVVSRAVVPCDLCDITVKIAGSILVEGKVIFLHPLQNYTIIQYDPALVKAPVLSAKLSSTEIVQGAPVYFIGYKTSGEIVHASTTVSRKYPFTPPSDSYSPRYQAFNIDIMTIDTNLGGQCGNGVLVDTDGTVQALWLTFIGERDDKEYESYYRGLAASLLGPVISQIREGVPPTLRILPVEFRSVELFEARLMGVSEEWINKVTEANKSRHLLFKVRRSFAVGNQERAFLEGDVILTLNDKLITRLSDLDAMYFSESLDALVVRGRKEVHITSTTLAPADTQEDRIIRFCGATIHQPDHMVRREMSKVYSEVYVSFYSYGSPSAMYKLLPARFITHVNGESTPDLDSFLEAIIKIPNDECKGFNLF
jgi:S1-C subfamily serine protease